jgi:hypothetical protein
MPEGRETGRMVSVGRPARVRSASACSAESGEVAGELGETRRLSQAREIFIGRKGTRGVVGGGGEGRERGAYCSSNSPVDSIGGETPGFHRALSFFAERVGVCRWVAWSTLWA